MRLPTFSRMTAAIAVVLLQTAFLASMVWDRTQLLAHGREIITDVEPVDPRDLFRGDYVILGYPFARSSTAKLPERARPGDAVYATLKPGAANTWSLTAFDLKYPDRVAPEDVVLKGRVEAQDAPTRVRYGIESYFVPEGTGRDLERQVREGKISAVLAVGRNGDAAIKALIVDGQRVDTEPAT